MNKFWVKVAIQCLWFTSWYSDSCDGKNLNNWKCIQSALIHLEDYLARLK